MDSGKFINWSIGLYDTHIASFSGNLSINKLGTPFGTKNISIYGSSGLESVSDLKKGNYQVTMTGTAIDIKGSVSHVLPGTQITFSVR